MPQTTHPKLDTGDQFPSLELNLVGGSTLKLPASTTWTLVLIYRGFW